MLRLRSSNVTFGEVEFTAPAEREPSSSFILLACSQKSIPTAYRRCVLPKKVEGVLPEPTPHHKKLAGRCPQHIAAPSV